MRVFLHLILTANWEPKKWRGITIERGQRVYSSQKLATELHISRQAARTAIKHLISTGEITNHPTPEYSIITVKNYDLYQQPTNDLTNEQPTTNQRLTNEQPQLKKDKESNNDKKVIKRDKRNFTPPTFDDVSAYCKERNSSVDPKKFFDYFNAGNWIDSKGNPVRNWKQKIITWEGRKPKSG